MWQRRAGHTHTHDPQMSKSSLSNVCFLSGRDCDYTGRTAPLSHRRVMLDHTFRKAAPVHSSSQERPSQLALLLLLKGCMSWLTRIIVRTAPLICPRQLHRMKSRRVQDASIPNCVMKKMPRQQGSLWAGSTKQQSDLSI